MPHGPQTPMPIALILVVTTQALMPCDAHVGRLARPGSLLAIVRTLGHPVVCPIALPSF